MTHHLQHITDLVEICRLKGIQQIVVSPGSRNAPLIELFFSTAEIKLHSIVDERSAGYYALGIALATQKPVVLLCTSGTAALNYSPALAEAYYQHIPLIAITADRPEELIDQQDSQTVRQKNVFRNFVKDSLHLKRPAFNGYNTRKQHAAIDKIINLAATGLKGPVHINVPIAEPLYVELPQPTQNIQISTQEIKENPVPKKLINGWKNNLKRMIVCGQMLPNYELNKTLNALTNEKKAVVLAEAISNIKGEKIISEIDRVMIDVEPTNNDFVPDILISVGGPVVSKRLKKWLQNQKGIIHFRISEEEDNIDTYQNLTGFIQGKAASIFKKLNETGSTSENYCTIWQNKYSKNTVLHNTTLGQLPYSDLIVFETIISQSPANCILHLGNSSPVRYAQLFDLSKFEQVYANRGVSGIDGCLSTATGFASQSDKINLLILGDLSFLYDSNALWNSKLPPNLKIVVINNGGGGIFRMIPGPAKLEAFEEFIETPHVVDIKKLAAAYGIEYFAAKTETELTSTFQRFIKFKSRPSLLEIKTPQADNAENYIEYIERIKSEDGSQKSEVEHKNINPKTYLL
ncbi:MAG: 2-succinyl-5-enolpyruvyl-6-hydroxy-3-cyclohexene-1-carboxylic-acid synthase [Prolixibacteraceae bacterium]|nr:2-succinyl-5-enolpyruvyl-6-hydroxy-3-cyclohexene-1-carboxylic-acid synthase [Prolixibacteraceae bacterium]